ncbi:hypothetical protein CDD80_5163 [Ophiocordyceps camponoti-rufipedis]|uniref:Uncharacterized protein n=1 Tax=Ophiocordyceps camponoti-rufipedis TaxID=2004952 RepID=A0A2C5ZM84_9HYPO|nr:hypothetical protein CDD80_5163 [Ophiocordyceps camponoti-rufipedis]
MPCLRDTQSISELVKSRDLYTRLDLGAEMMVSSIRSSAEMKHEAVPERGLPVAQPNDADVEHMYPSCDCHGATQRTRRLSTSPGVGITTISQQEVVLQEGNAYSRYIGHQENENHCVSQTPKFDPSEYSPKQHLGRSRPEAAVEPQQLPRIDNTFHCNADVTGEEAKGGAASLPRPPAGVCGGHDTDWPMGLI